MFPNKQNMVRREWKQDLSTLRQTTLKEFRFHRETPGSPFPVVGAPFSRFWDRHYGDTGNGEIPQKGSV